jgi:tetratricopeptide (TPR) repeat protein
MRRFAVLASLALVSACSTAPGPQPVNQAPPSQQVPAQSGGAAPRATPGSSEANASAPNAPIDQKVAELEAAYAKNPGDASAKKQLADASFENAQFYMYKSPLPPNQKYPKALALYKRTVDLDPSNVSAKESIDMIESIYRSMGKPVPAV